MVVLGRTYTIYNDVLNSNVPAILREQGAMAIPVDCYPVGEDVPVFNDMYWGYGQRNLRAAHQIRRTPGVYSLFCCNYSCGPDSFSLHFYTHIMEGKPFAIIETDGHSGDAGTKTRIEAFLYCVRQHIQAGGETTEGNRLDLTEQKSASMRGHRARNETVLLPWFGTISDALDRPLPLRRAEHRAASHARPRRPAPRPAPHLGQGVRAHVGHAGQRAPADREG